MVHTLQLIVFHSIKYQEADLLVYAYTHLYGRQTYLFRKARTAHKHNVAALIFPLSILEAEAYHKPGGKIQHIKTIHQGADLSRIRTDLHKSSIALFLGELLYKSIKEEEANLPLYQFLVESIQALNDMECSVANFHLYFLAQFCARLGYAPLPNYHPEHTPLFDITQGAFRSLQAKQEVSPHTTSDLLFSKEESRLLAQLSICSTPLEAAAIPLNGTQRHQFVTQMIRYLHYHLGGLPGMKSPEVLRQLF